VAVADSYSVNEATTNNTFNVLTNDYDPDAGDTISISAIGAANHGGTVVNNTTNLRYTPNVTYVGVETFTYTIRDLAGLTATATVTVTVNNVNNPPVANNDSYSVLQHSTNNTFTVLANDTDPDVGDTLTISAVGALTHGGVVTRNAGPTPPANTQLIYTPDTAYVGVESFTYSITDPGGLFSSATVTVTVTNVNDPPVAVNDAFSVSEDSANNILAVLANDSDPDAGDTIPSAPWARSIMAARW